MSAKTTPSGPAPGPAELSGWYSEETATFGDRVAAAREAAGLGQDALARRLGVAPRTLRNWEQDLSEPRANRLQMLAGVLNVSLMWLLTGEGEGLDVPPDPGAPPDVAGILAELRRMRAEASRMAARLERLEGRLRDAVRARRE